LILASVVIICVEVLIAEKRKNTMAINVEETINTTGDDNNLQNKSTLKAEQKRLSI
jgi:hypothetical protein